MAAAKVSFLPVFLLVLLAISQLGCAGAKIEATSAAMPFGGTIRDIETAKLAISRSPESAVGYRALASAYIKAGRQTGDPKYTTEAFDAIDKGFGVAPDDVLLKKLQATLLLSDHQFGEAEKVGESLLATLPNDAFVYGVLVDANAELGNYDKAAEFAQKMVDKRPDSSAYARVAHIRSLFGDHAGAVEMYILAARTADPADTEAQAWCLYQLGMEYWRNGKYEDSLRSFDESLSILPNYYHSLAGKGRVLASQSKFKAAAENLERSQTISPALDTVILLGKVYSRLGENELAEKQVQLAENGKEKLGGHYDEHRMALYWADKGENLDHALEVAVADYGVVKDIYGSDILAWCYFKSGDLKQAQAKINEAKRLKTPDARLYFHAGMIEKALGNVQAAKTNLKTALELNPEFDPTDAEIARKALSEIE